MTKVKRFSLFLCLLSAGLLFIISGFILYENYSYPLMYEQEIRLYAQEYNLDPVLVASVICAESRFRPEAVSSRGAIGLMQVMPQTALYIAIEYNDSGFKEQDLFTPATNIKYGCRYLKYLFSKFNELETVLASYNAGEGNVQRWLQDARYSADGKIISNTPFAETNFYLQKIKKCMTIYAKKFS